MTDRDDEWDDEWDDLQPRVMQSVTSPVTSTVTATVTSTVTATVTSTVPSWQSRGLGRGCRGRLDILRDNQNQRRPHRRYVLNQRPNEGNSHVIMVPSTSVSYITGRGGLKVFDLERKSNAKIKIGVSSGYETAITLYGSTEAVTKAEEFIKNLTIEYYGAPQSEQDQGRDEASGGEDVSHTKSYVIKDASGVQVVDLPKFCDHLMRLIKLPPIVKDFYKKQSKADSTSSVIMVQWKRRNDEIQVKRTFDEKPGLRPFPNPVGTFEEAFQDYPDILAKIRKQGFRSPSAIQSQAWPTLLRGEDMIGIAGTGAGKTLAFLLPALIHIEGQPTPREQRDGPIVLILVPTQEVALRIDKEVSRYEYQGIKSVCLYGGSDRKEVIKGVDIVIATPDILNDLVKTRRVNAVNFSYVVLDELDIMVDMGFESLIRIFPFEIRPDKQTVMTSVTWPPCIRSLAELYMKDPIQVNISSLSSAAMHTQKIATQKIKFMDEEEKDATLLHFLTNLEPYDKVIIFCNTRYTAIHVDKVLSAKNIWCQILLGPDRNQSREMTLKDMAEGRENLLITADGDSRGIDIKDLTHVVNYDFPMHIEEYVHRISRAGRAGKTCIALSFVTGNDYDHAGELMKIMKKAKQEIPRVLEQMAENFEAMKLQVDSRLHRYTRVRDRR